MNPDHRSGTAPGKPTTKQFTLSLGLVSIPLAIWPGTDVGSSAIKRSQFTTEGDPIGNQNYNKVTGETYTGEVVKKVVIDKTIAVELTEEEVELVTGGRIKGVAEVDCFIPLATVGTDYVVVDIKQLRPAQLEVGDTKRDNPAAVKVFALLGEAMANAEVAALFKVTPSRGSVRYAAWCPDGTLAMLAFASEVRAAVPMPEMPVGSDKERAQISALVASMTEAAPVLVDDAGDKIRDYILAKAATGEVIEAAEAPEPKVDTSLEDMLAASLAALGVAA